MRAMFEPRHFTRYRTHRRKAFMVGELSSSDGNFYSSDRGLRSAFLHAALPQGSHSYKPVASYAKNPPSLADKYAEGEG